MARTLRVRVQWGMAFTEAAGNPDTLRGTGQRPEPGAWHWFQDGNGPIDYTGDTFADAIQAAFIAVVTDCGKEEFAQIEEYRAAIFDPELHPYWDGMGGKVRRRVYTAASNGHDQGPLLLWYERKLLTGDGDLDVSWQVLEEA